jgi:hypothetical protein
MPRAYRQLIKIAAVLLLLSLIVVIYIDLQQPEKLEPEWEIDLESYDICDIEVSPYEEALLVLYSGDKSYLYLTAYNCNGHEIWSWVGYNGKYLKEIRFWDGKICIYQYSRLDVLSGNGEDLWQFTAAGNNPPKEAFGIGTPADLLVAISGTMYGFDADGQVVWGLPNANAGTDAEYFTYCRGWRHPTTDNLWVGAAGNKAIAHRSDGTVAWGPVGKTLEGATFIPYPDGSVCRVSDELKHSDSCHFFGLEWHEPDGSERFRVSHCSIYNEQTAPDGGIYYRGMWIYPDGNEVETPSDYPSVIELNYADDGSKIGIYFKDKSSPASGFLSLFGGHRYKYYEHMLVDRPGQPLRKYMLPPEEELPSVSCHLLGGLMVTSHNVDRFSSKLLAFRVPE